jgi:hypothetical protein
MVDLRLITKLGIDCEPFLPDYSIRARLFSFCQVTGEACDILRERCLTRKPLKQADVIEYAWLVIDLNLAPADEERCSWTCQMSAGPVSRRFIVVIWQVGFCIESKRKADKRR